MVTVWLRNPDREVEVEGAGRVKDLLAKLGIPASTVLVIRDRALLTREDVLVEGDRVEVRPVISGGSGNS